VRLDGSARAGSWLAVGWGVVSLPGGRQGHRFLPIRRDDRAWEDRTTARGPVRMHMGHDGEATCSRVNTPGN
jgi:hypothetical protein